MSIDIVGFVEHLSGQDVLSVSEGPIHFYREYEFFCAISGVRKETGLLGEGFEPLIQPRGLPEKKCREIEIAYEELGGKHASWLTRQEILNCCAHANIEEDDIPLSGKIVLAILAQIESEVYQNKCTFSFFFY